MTIKSLELLKTVGLLDKNDQVADLSKFSSEELQGFIDYYAKHRLNEAEKELRDWKQDPDALISFTSSISARNAVIPLLPSALVYTQNIVHDPVFKLSSETQSKMATAVNEYLGYTQKHISELNEVINALSFFQELSPLIRAGIVHSLPTEVLHRSPQEMTINFSPDWYRSQVPDAIHDYVHNNVVIHEMRPNKSGKGLVVVSRPRWKWTS